MSGYSLIDAAVFDVKDRHSTVQRYEEQMIFTGISFLIERKYFPEGVICLSDMDDKPQLSYAEIALGDCLFRQ